MEERKGTAFIFPFYFTNRETKINSILIGFKFHKLSFFFLSQKYKQLQAVSKQISSVTSHQT